jgi:hypothetical protein
MLPLTVPDHHKVLQNRFFDWCKVGVCRARCCALSLAPGPSHGGIGRVDSTRVSQLRLRGKATEPAQSPLKQVTIEVCDHAKGGSLFQSGCQGNPSSCGGPCHGSVLEKCKAPTNKQACLQAGIISKSFPKNSNQCILCVQGWRARGWSPRDCEQWVDLHLGQDVQMVLSPFSRWSAPLNRAIPPGSLVKSAHIYDDSVRNRSCSGGPGIVRSVSFNICTC